MEKGHGFLDRMIALVEGAQRQKTPNEIALTILLAALTFIFLLVCVTLKPFGLYSAAMFSVPVLIALLVCLIPTTIGGLLSAIGIAGMDRVLQRNVLAMSGRAVEAAGDVDVLLLDKTGTITLGNRMATEFLTAPNVKPERLADAAQLASLRIDTGRPQHVVLAQQLDCAREARSRRRNLCRSRADADGGRPARRTARSFHCKGAADDSRLRGSSGDVPERGVAQRDEISRPAHTAGRPSPEALGVVHLKDVVKGGIG
jgi:K+-transporting ATPase ATPase B chain